MRLLANGHSQAEVARRLKVTAAAVCQWAKKQADEGDKAWKKGRRGPPEKITEKHRAVLAKELPKGAQAHGYMNELWTLPRIAEMLRRESGLRVHPGHLWRILGQMGWSVQRPEKRATQRDEKEIAHWKRHTWPALKKRPGGKTAPSSSSTSAA